jgi:hypothetical protein
MTDHTQDAQKNDSSEKFRHLDLDTVNAGSSMECTGLIPSAPKTEAEREAYKDLYDYQANTKDAFTDEKPPVLHGNSAKIEGEVFTCQSYRSPTPPDQYDFSTLPGSKDDLKSARKNSKQS